MTIPSSDSEPGGLLPPASRGGIATQVIAAMVLMTGLWVAASPRFLTPQSGDTVTATDVIIGLLVAGVTTLALVCRSGFPGMQFTSLVVGVWVVLIASFMLDARRAGAAPWYWSNTWSGTVLAVLALAELSTLRPATH